MTGAFSLAWIVLLLPLVSAGLITLFTLKNDKLSAKISIGAVIGGFVLSLLIFSPAEQPGNTTSPGSPLVISRPRWVSESTH